MQWNLCKISADTQICTFGELDCSATFALSAILCDDLFCFEVAAGSSIEFRKCRSVVVGMLIRIRAWCSCQTFPSAIITPLHHSCPRPYRPKYGPYAGIWPKTLVYGSYYAHYSRYGPFHWTPPSPQGSMNTNHKRAFFISLLGGSKLFATQRVSQ